MQYWIAIQIAQAHIVPKYNGNGIDSYWSFYIK